MKANLPPASIIGLTDRTPTIAVVASGVLTVSDWAGGDGELPVLRISAPRLSSVAFALTSRHFGVALLGVSLNTSR